MINSVYYSVPWREAPYVKRKLKQSDLQYSITQWAGLRDIVFIFPGELSVSQHVFLYALFDREAKDLQEYQKKR